MRLIGLAVVLVLSLLVASLGGQAHQSQPAKLPQPHISVTHSGKDCENSATQKAKTSQLSFETRKDDRNGYLTLQLSWSA